MSDNQSVAEILIQRMTRFNANDFPRNQHWTEFDRREKREYFFIAQSTVVERIYTPNNRLRAIAVMKRDGTSILARVDHDRRAVGIKVIKFPDEAAYENRVRAIRALPRFTW